MFPKSNYKLFYVKHNCFIMYFLVLIYISNFC